MMRVAGCGLRMAECWSQLSSAGFQTPLRPSAHSPGTGQTAVSSPLSAIHPPPAISLLINPSSSKMLAKNVVARSAAARPVMSRCSFRPAPQRATVSRAFSVAVKAELKVGDSMKDVAEYYRVLSSSDGGSVSLSSFQGKKPVVLFFYPKAATPGCTKEACAFRDAYKRFEDAGAVVFGISSDSPADNAAFAKANNLQFPLLSDSSSILRKVFGIKGDLLGLLPGRQTYVIDANGKVVMTFNDQFQPEKHVDEALAALAKLPATVKA